MQSVTVMRLQYRGVLGVIVTVVESESTASGMMLPLCRMHPESKIQLTNFIALLETLYRTRCCRLADRPVRTAFRAAPVFRVL